MAEPSTANYQPSSKIKTFFTFWFASYLFLNIFPWPFTTIHFVYNLFLPYLHATGYIVNWTGKNILHLPNFGQGIGGFEIGDGIFGYVQLFTFALLSGIITCFVFLIDKRIKKSSRLYYWIIVYLRYSLAITMLGYGFMKIIMDEGQFIFPSVATLEQPVGNLSPMGLLWAFMGYSQPYEIFTGIAEIAGGYLLFFNRTKAFGSLIVIGVMSNVVMMEFSYDVNLKLISIHLLLISFLILSPDIRRIIDFFIFHKTISLSSSVNNFDKKWMRISRVVLKSIIIIGFTSLIIYTYRSVPSAPKSHLYGVYKTERFILNNDTANVSKVDTIGWKKMIIDNDYNYTQIITKDDSVTYYQASIDTTKKTLQLTAYNDTTAKYQFVYSEKPDNYLELSGKWKGDDVSITFKKKDMQEYPLVSRGFHWINEYPHIGRNIIDNAGH